MRLGFFLIKATTLAGFDLTTHISCFLGGRRDDTTDHAAWATDETVFATVNHFS
jgi:hypothetical protein